MNAVIYTRVSTDEQAASGLGLEAQLAACRGYCALRGHTVVGEYSDPAVSGRDEPLGRPGLAALLALESIREHVVVVYSVSRLTRRQSQMWRLLDDRGDFQLRLESATESFDTTSPMGRAMLGMLGVWAQLEADQVSERTKAAFKAKRARGAKLGPKCLEEVDAPLVARIVGLWREQGANYGHVARTLNEEGLRTRSGAIWYPKTVRAIILRQIAAAKKGVGV
jgi:DNA invertase Pin-like site-specific DNA recombinase